VSSLYFAATGDTRPNDIDDSTPNGANGYPVAVIDSIYQDIQNLNPRPQFVVATGDYQFCSVNGGQQQTQLSLYETAREYFSGPLFAAMGNHECNGDTDSNCGSGTSTGVTDNMSAFMNTLLTPIGQTNPYYAIDITSNSDAPTPWTAKFVVVAPNAWSSAQQSWLETEMAKTTTYTFLVRHEPITATSAPAGLAASQSVIANYPVTLYIEGHSHEYKEPESGSPIVVVGNGGAPLDNPGSDVFGYSLITQTASGDIEVAEYNASTNAIVNATVVPK
jgi:hypothetical protein